jgi:hypothetical protein
MNEDMLDYVAPVEICNRCIVVVNVSTIIRARQTGYVIENYSDITDVKKLIEWARRMIIRGADIEMNTCAHAFEAISTWNGDPVCQVHLWERLDAERKGY